MCICLYTYVYIYIYRDILFVLCIVGLLGNYFQYIGDPPGTPRGPQGRQVQSVAYVGEGVGSWDRAEVTAYKGYRCKAGPVTRDWWCPIIS